MTILVIRENRELIVGEEGEGVVLEEDLLKGGGLVEEGGGEGGEQVVGQIQQGQRPQPCTHR